MPAKKKKTSKIVIPETFREFYDAYFLLPREDKKRLMEFSAKLDELLWEYHLDKKYPERVAQREKENWDKLLSNFAKNMKKKEETANESI
jgi:hypothetical protein